MFAVQSSGLDATGFRVVNCKNYGTDSLEGGRGDVENYSMSTVAILQRAAVSGLVGSLCR